MKNEIPEAEKMYFEIQAEAGITKHLRGLEGTKEIVELCKINKNSYVLDVGCGVGLTPIYLAKKIGCKIVGVDISEKMISKAKQKTKQERVSDRIEYQVADARKLPFKDNSFDVIICESVLAFVGDKEKAIEEYKRVVKPNGYIGINEAIWIKKPPKKATNGMGMFGAHMERVDSDELKKIMQKKLREVVVKTYELNMLNESINNMKRVGFMGSIDIMKSWFSIIPKMITNKRYRDFMKKAFSLPKDMVGYMGCGIYVGRK